MQVIGLGDKRTNPTPRVFSVNEKESGKYLRSEQLAAKGFVIARGLWTLRQRQKIVGMKPVVLRLDVLVAVVHSDNHVCPSAVDPRVERVHLALDFRDRGCLRFLPPSVGGFPADAVNPIMRILPVCLVNTANLQIHILSLSLENQQSPTATTRIIR